MTGILLFNPSAKPGGTLFSGLRANLSNVGFALAWAISLAASAYADETRQISVSLGDVAKEPESSQEGPGSKLEEVIVTAQKRAEDIQSIPISAQVIGGQTLAEENHTSLEELTETVPAVHISTGGYENNVFIRGIGSGADPAFDQSVSTFDDDIYHGRSRMSEATFLDLERIEVLKGPQSTFFGNNAIAGALNIVTKKPGDTFDAWARTLYGMFGQYAVEGAAGGPITDTFGARLAVTRNGDDRGWLDNVTLNQEVPRINNLAGRLTLVFKPTEDLDTTLKIEGSDHRTAGTFGDQPTQWINCPPPAPLTPNFSANGSCANVLALNAAAPGTVPMGLDNNKTVGLAGQGNHLSTFEDVLTINYLKWDHTFTSVSGHYNEHSNATGDVNDVGEYLDSLTIEAPESYHQFSQEFRVASPTGGSVEYLAGAYFQTDQLAFVDYTNAPYLNSLIQSTPPFAPLVPYLPFAISQGFSQSEKVYSVFGSLKWNVTDRLKLNTGLRGSRVDKDVGAFGFAGTGTQTYGGFVPLPRAVLPYGAALLGVAGGTLQGSRSDKAWMPSAGIQYQVDSQVMAYFSYSRGFKAGGFDGLNSVIGPPHTLVAYEPEHVNAYELGLKSKWLDDRVLFDLDVFRSNYNALQVEASVFIPSLNAFEGRVANAAVSVSQGVEFEGQWAVTKDFRLSANVTYLESYYVSYPNGPLNTEQKFCAQSYVLPYCSIYPNPVPPSADLSGQPTEYAPRWSGSVSASYSLLLPADYKFTTDLSPYFTSAYDTDSGDPFYHVSAYVRLDGRLTLEKTGDRWAFDLIGKNLTNRIIVANPSGFSLYQVSKEQPRNVAIQFRYRW
jgi:iron complex outermembrane receptor protein